MLVHPDVVASDEDLCVCVALARVANTDAVLSGLAMGYCGAAEALAVDVLMFEVHGFSFSFKQPSSDCKYNIGNLLQSVNLYLQ